MPTFAEQQVTKLETLMGSVPPGVQSVTVDGTIVSLRDIEEKYVFWKKRVAIESGTKPRVSQVNLGGF
jgi:hypothetical protein